jgi:type II secretory pathway pseudopilin PulG
MGCSSHCLLNSRKPVLKTIRLEQRFKHAGRGKMMKMDGANSRRRSATDAFTMVEVLMGVLILAIMTVSLYSGFSSGFAVVRLSRDNVRATQVLLKKMETLRLFNWNQITTSTNYLKPTFTELYDPLAKNGTVYAGTITTNMPDITAAYRTNMRLVTVTVYWTNYSKNPNQRQVVRSRQMQTYVARYGMQPYLYQ